MTRGFLTIAYGANRYIRMGKALARSIRLHSKSAVLAVVTDSNDRELARLADYIIPINMSFGSGVSQKLYVDKYTLFDETLFLDSDCLVYSDPNLLWDLYTTSHGFGVKGWGYLGPDNQHHAVENMRIYLNHYGVKRLGAFNSGLFYFNRSETAANVFETGRKVARERDIVGLRSFKNSPVAHEPVIAMAMEIQGVEMLPWEEGNAMSTALGTLKGALGVNVLKGASAYVKNGQKVQPIVIHYNVSCQNYFMYRRELHRLALPSWMPRGTLANVTVLPEFMYVKLRYYITRARTGVRDKGLLGLVPQRFHDRFARG